MKHLTWIFFLGLGLTTQSWATGTVTGVISDETGTPLPSATVVAADGKGVFTDMDGRYSIELEAGKQSLTFSFIGYLNKTRKVNVEDGSTTTLNVRLAEDAVLLNESIVVGYGVQRKKEVTGAISTIDSKEITAVQTPSFEAALQGQAAGVQVTQGSGMAGSGSIIRVRGLSSISAGGDPLYVIDGIPITQDYFLGGNSGAMNRNPLASINPNDIKDIQILKDAAATGIYGSRGANGVILITTKRGVREGVKVNYSSQFGWGQPTARPNMMSTEEYLAIRQEAWENDGGTGYAWLPYLSSADDSPEVRRLAYEEALQTNTDWFDLMTRTSQKMQQNISFRSGGEKWSMYNAVSYDKNESYAIGNAYTRTTLRTNLTLNPIRGLQIDLQGSTATGENQRVNGGWSGGVGSAMSTALPYMAPVTKDTLFDDNGNVLGVQDDYQLNVWNNPYASIANGNQRWRETEYRNLVTGQITYSPVPRITAIVTGGYDQSVVEEDNFRGAVLNQFDQGADTRLSWSQRTSPNFNFGGNLTFDAIANDTMKLSLMVGGEGQQFASTGFWTNSVNTTGPAYENAAIRDSLLAHHDSTIVYSAIEQYSTWKDVPTTFASTFARMNYSFKDRYFFQATARTDASSKFGRNNRYGFFPSASLGWVMSDEPWFNMPRLSFLKVRTSWGRTGNANIPGSAKWELYQDQTGGATYSGDTIIYPLQPGNPDLRWETVETIDASIEAGLLEDRVSVELGVYNKLASDVLMNVELPSHTGWSNRYVNAGEVLNRGVELSVTSNNLTGELQWKTTFNYNYNYNELVSTGDFTPDAISGGTNDSRAVPGQPLTTYYLVPFSHVDPSTGLPVYTGPGVNVDEETGLPIYPTLGENETFDYDLENRQAVGDGLPDHILGLSNVFTYRNWTLSSLFTASIGAKIWDSSAKRQLGVVTDWNMRTDLFDRWRQPGDDALYPVLTMDETTYGLPNGFPWWNTSLFMYDASYVRLRNLSLEYRIPSSNGLVTLKVTGNNLFAITDFVGLDPELVRDFENAQDRNFSGGANYLTAPQERSLLFSINANF